jgi:hypothetical protein
MNPWIETAGSLLLALVGVILGRWFSRQPRGWWMAGHFIPLLLLLLIALPRYFSDLEFVPPMSWLISGRTKFALAGFISTLILTTPLSRLPDRRFRAWIVILMTLLVVYSSAWPFLAPAFNRAHLAGLTTRIDGNGVCEQSNDYTCGPASAVTALLRLGLPAEEGTIAIAAHTSSAIGTPPDLLRDALKRLYPTNGLICEYRHFKSIADLQNGGFTLAVIKFAPLVDHYVTVLEVTQ